MMVLLDLGMGSGALLGQVHVLFRGHNTSHTPGNALKVAAQ